MAATKPVIHHRDHEHGGADPVRVVWEDIGTGAGGGGGTTSTNVFATPAAVPLMFAEAGPSDGFGWTRVRVEPASRGNAVRTNSYTGHTAAVNDYLTGKVTLGPKGSVWGVTATYLRRPEGGQFRVALASVATPNPARAGVNDQGTLVGTASVTYIEPAGWPLFDTYDTTVYDDRFNGFHGFRVMGDPGTAFTTVTVGGDTVTGYDLIDGGPGVYNVRARVTGKAAASTGYRCELSGLAFLRLDDDGYL
jgi:hypothetical protein